MATSQEPHSFDQSKQDFEQQEATSPLIGSKKQYQHTEEKELSSAINIQELQMMATQAMSTANNFPESNHETDTKVQFDATAKLNSGTFIKSSQIDAPERVSHDEAATLDSIKVGYGGVEKQARNNQASQLTSMDAASNSKTHIDTGIPKNDNEVGGKVLGLTSDRFHRAQASNSIRKNNLHLRKAQGSRIKLDKINSSELNEHMASTHLRHSLDKSKYIQSYNQTNDETGHTVSNERSMQSMAPAKNKQNSVDQIKLKSILNQFEQNSELNDNGNVPKHPRNLDYSQNKSFNESASETSKAHKQFDGQKRMQQAIRPHLYDIPDSTPSRLPTLNRNENLSDTRNNTFSVAKFGKQPDFDQQLLFNPQQRQRNSFGQLKQSRNAVQGEGSGPTLIQAHSMVDMKQTQYLTLPDVPQAAVPQTQQTNAIFNDKQMLINDYNATHNAANIQLEQDSHLITSDSQQSIGMSFNKLQFRSAESRKKIPRMDHSAASMKKKIIDNQSSAIKIVKRQQSKFSMHDGGTMPTSVERSPKSFASKYMSLLAEPGLAYTTSLTVNKHSYTRRVQPQSAIMQQLLACSRKASSQNLNNSEKLPHDLSNCPSQIKDQLPIPRVDLGEKKRIRTAQEQISLAEIAVTNAQNSNNLSQVEVDQMLQSYVQSLQNTLILVNARNTTLTNELQQFVQTCVIGIQNSARLRQKLLDEQVERFEKSKEQFEKRIVHQDTRISKMQTELNQRPYQKHFRTEEELEEEIEELRKLSEERHRMTNEVEASHYSGAQDELDKLTAVFRSINKMGVANISCSYVDKALFTEKQVTVGAIGQEIKDEGNSAIRATAKRVLDNFWRYYTTQSVGTQTEEKVIDSLKKTIKHQKDLIQSLRRDIDELNNSKIDLETEIERCKGMAEHAKKSQKEKEEKLAEIESMQESIQSEMTDLRNQVTSKSTAIQSLNEDNTNLQKVNDRLSERLEFSQAQLANKIALISQMEQSPESLPTTPMDIQESPPDNISAGGPGSDTERLDVSSEMKKQSFQKKKQGKGKKAKKGIKKDASKASIDKSQLSQSNSQTKLVEKLSPDAEMKLKRQLRADLTDEIEGAMRRQVKEAQQKAQEAEKAKEKNEQRIKELQDMVKDREQKLQKLMEQNIVISDQNTDSLKLEKSRKTVTSNQKPGSQRPGGRESVNNDNSMMESSQFSITKPMPPKFSKGGFGSAYQSQKGFGIEGLTSAEDSVDKNDNIASREIIVASKNIDAVRNEAKKYDSPKITRNASGTQIKDNQIDLNKNAPNDNRNQNQSMKTGPRRRKDRKVNQGSQVEKSLLEPSTVYNDGSQQMNADAMSVEIGRDMSIGNMDKLDGNLETGQETLYDKDNDGQNIINIPIDTRLNRNYGNVINSFSQDDTEYDKGIKSSETTTQRLKIIKTLSDQTLYKNNTSAEKYKEKSLSSILLQQMPRPKIKLESDLAVESQQYQARKATSMDLSGGQRKSKDTQNNSGQRINQKMIADGDKMLLEQFTGMIPNKKLEKFQKIVDKAYGDQSQTSAHYMLEQAKEHLEGTELKLLMLMLQMRGQFDRTGGPMQSKSSQTEGILIFQDQQQHHEHQIAKATRQKLRDAKSVPALQMHKANDVMHQDTQNITSQRIMGQQHDFIEEEDDQELDNNLGVGHVTVSSRLPFFRQPSRQFADVGVQACGELIKVAMDRVKLLDKNKYMFYGGSGFKQQHSSADKFTHLDGTFSPAPLHSKQPAAVRANILKDFGTNDRVMIPSFKKIQAQKEFENAKQRLRYESQMYDSYKANQKSHQTNQERLKPISVDNAYDLVQKYNNEQTPNMTTPIQTNNLTTDGSPQRKTVSNIYLNMQDSEKFPSNAASPLRKVFQQQQHTQEMKPQ